LAGEYATLAILDQKVQCLVTTERFLMDLPVFGI